MRSVRAKFRCLGITHKWNKEIVAELGVVMNKKGEHYQENKLFWEYTPTGKCELVFHEECELEVGAYYYVDLVETEEEDAWHLNSLRLSDNGQGDVSFSWYKPRKDYQAPLGAGMHRGSLEMGIESGKTKALDAFQKPGTRWKVAFTFANASDD